MANTHGFWLLVALASLLSACATITTGNTQTVDVASSPGGAECTLTREGESLGKVTTPGVLTIKRGRLPISVVCTKDGYEEGQTVMNAQAEKAAYANAIVGGFIGMAIDRSSGADRRYDPSVSVELTAMSEADRAARVTAHIPAPPSSSNPRDGGYRGGLMLGDTEITLREIEVTVAGNRGEGKVTQKLCDEPGKIEFTVDPSGAVTGEMDVRQSGSCGPYKMTVDGRLENGVVALNVKLGDRTIPFSLQAMLPGSAASVPPSARVFTGAWTAHNVVIAEKSAGNCYSSQGVVYSLNLVGDTLEVDNVNGHMVTTTVPADGRISQTFRSSSGAQLEIVGNARTRDLEIVNFRFGCHWKLTPV